MPAAIQVRVRLGQGGILGMVGWSVIGHVVFTTGLLFLPRVIPRKPPPPILMTAAIVSMPDQQPGGGAPAPKPVRTGPTPEERARKAEEAARKAQEPPEPEPPEPRKPPKKKEKKADPPRPVKPDPTTPAPPGSKKPPEEPARPEPEPEPAAPEPAAPLSQGVGLGAGGQAGEGGGIPSITSASFPYQYYRTILVNNIRARWNRPLTPGLKEPLRCAVAFVISKNGQVSGVSLSVPSGFPPLDDSAVRAVLDSNPLPPLPYQYSTSSVRAEMIFELTPE